MQTSIAQTLTETGRLTVNILIYPCEEGGFTAECVEIPGCVSEGESEAEAEANIRKAVDSCLSVIFEDSLNHLRPNLDPVETTLRSVSRQRELVIDTPRLHDSLTV